ncbi:hypothetical protein THARTR1_02883 [Trichoderma harzianum]|uniref:HNH nuclease domain-containing protein n=1 Tax=Trichoderma harzianum TaxID=5544 RepID=A0A2K0UGX0_TRIHA|nr:hypothetical protein THARTR1_02883 [Trichoderma harzianum]
MGGKRHGKQRMTEKVRRKAESIIKDRLQSKKAHLAQSEKLVINLNSTWHAGILDLSEDEFRFQIKQLERLITALRGDVAVIHTSRHELGGRLMDNMIWQQYCQNTDEVYLDLLISRYKTPEEARLPLFAPRDPSAQERFRKRVLKAYDAEHRGSQWCVISGKLLDVATVRAAHIVGYNVGEPSARHLFGPPSDKDGHLMAEKNGIPMHYTYEEAFDDARLVIVPEVQPYGNPREGCWKVYCLDDPDTHEENIHIPYSRELHGRSLQFRNDFRPSARYLYFAFCMSILRRQRHQAPGWWRDYLVDGPGKAWATPGTYLHTSTLRRLARQVSHLNAREAAVFAPGPADEDEDAEMLHVQVELLAAAYLDRDSPTFKGERLPRRDERDDESRDESREEEDDDDDDEGDEEM